MKCSKTVRQSILCAVSRLLNLLSGAQRLNDLNVWSGPRLLNGWRAASFSLEVTFRVKKVTAKLLNDAFYALLYC
jgi:hypothetical protein